MTQTQEKVSSQREIEIRRELYGLIKEWLIDNRPETWANIQTNIKNSDPIETFLAKQTIYEGDTADSIFDHQYFLAELENNFPKENKSPNSSEKLGLIGRLLQPLYRQKGS